MLKPTELQLITFTGNGKCEGRKSYHEADPDVIVEIMSQRFK